MDNISDSFHCAPRVYNDKDKHGNRCRKIKGTPSLDLSFVNYVYPIEDRSVQVNDHYCWHTETAMAYLYIHKDGSFYMHQNKISPNETDRVLAALGIEETTTPYNYRYRRYIWRNIKGFWDKIFGWDGRGIVVPTHSYLFSTKSIGLGWNRGEAKTVSHGKRFNEICMEICKESGNSEVQRIDPEKYDFEKEFG